MSETVSLLVVAGTRPEVLKLAPVVRALDASTRLVTKVCLSGQHGALAHDIAREIGFRVDFDLGSTDSRAGARATPSAADLSESLARMLERLSTLIGGVGPAGVVVQGDTTTALAGSIASFHHRIPSFHVEAGLRTSDPLRPFPEEMHRRLVTRLASLHFAPTEHARANLLAEGVPASAVVVTGNTVVDALEQFAGPGAAAGAPGEVRDVRPMLLVTLHRREGAALAAAVARAVGELSDRGDVRVTWIRHPNATSEAALAALAALGPRPAVEILEPQPYGAFVSLMRRARVILTDSGGVQEEAPVLGVPVIVLRDETDRPEAVATGNAVVAGGDAAAIVRTCRELVDDAALHARRSRAASPFGDGRAGPRVAAAIEAYFSARG